MGLRNGQEHRARQSGRAKSRSERAAARLRHRYHTACCAELIGVAQGAQWMERERREAVRGPAPLPGSWGRAAPMRILGNGRPRGGKASARRCWRPEQSRNAEVHAGRSRGGEGQESSPRSGWAVGAWTPRPSGPRCRAGVGPSSLLVHAASLAQRPAGPGPRQPPASGSSFLAFPGGGG